MFDNDEQVYLGDGVSVSGFTMAMMDGSSFSKEIGTVGMDYYQDELYICDGETGEGIGFKEEELDSFIEYILEVKKKMKKGL